MQKRILSTTVVLLSVILVTLGYTNSEFSQFTPDQLVVKACGGTVIGVNAPPELVPELRAAAANALAELVTDARGQAAPFGIDDGSIWEAIAGQGPNPECRAVGEILLPQIYLDPLREDNPFSDDELGFGMLIASVASPPEDTSIELTRARVEALVVICRRALFSGKATLIVSRLESVVNGEIETIPCRGQEVSLDGRINPYEM